MLLWCFHGTAVVMYIATCNDLQRWQNVKTSFFRLAGVWGASEKAKKLGKWTAQQQAWYSSKNWFSQPRCPRPRGPKLALHVPPFLCVRGETKEGKGEKKSLPSSYIYPAIREEKSKLFFCTSPGFKLICTSRKINLTYPEKSSSLMFECGLVSVGFFHTQWKNVYF